MTIPKNNQLLPSPFKRVLPESMHVGKDHLLLRLDFYKESIVMQTFEKKEGKFKIISPHDISQALANEMPFSSGMLPANTLWWTNSKSGPVTALWVEPGVRRLALQTEALKPERYNVPLPGLIFLCRPGQSPMVYAAYSRPTSPKERVYKAPLANVYDDGRTCAGNHKYPANIADIPDDFFRSFFSAGANLDMRSKKHQKNIIDMWKELDRAKKTEYPLLDLVYHGTVQDLMVQRI